MNKKRKSRPKREFFCKIKMHHIFTEAREFLIKKLYLIRMFETIVSYLKKSFIFSSCFSILEAGSFAVSLAAKTWPPVEATPLRCCSGLRLASAAEASRLFSLAAGRPLVAMPLAEPSKEEI
jgi:hypothetical protein